MRNILKKLRNRARDTPREVRSTSALAKDWPAPERCVFGLSACKGPGLGGDNDAIISPPLFSYREAIGYARAMRPPETRTPKVWVEIAIYDMDSRFEGERQWRQTVAYVNPDTQEVREVICE